MRTGDERKGNVEVRYAHEWPDATHKRIETAGHSSSTFPLRLRLFPDQLQKKKRQRNVDPGIASAVFLSIFLYIGLSMKMHRFADRPIKKN